MFGTTTTSKDLVSPERFLTYSWRHYRFYRSFITFRGSLIKQYPSFFDFVIYGRLCQFEETGVWGFVWIELVDEVCPRFVLVLPPSLLQPVRRTLVQRKIYTSFTDGRCLPLLNTHNSFFP